MKPGMTQGMNDVRAWWSGLSARDRRILLIGAALAVPLLAWAMIWQPLVKARETARQAHADLSTQHAEVRQLAAQLKARTGGTATPSANSAQSPLAAVETVAREQRIMEQLKRREAEGTSGVRVLLDDVPADALMRFMETLNQRHGLHITQAQIDPASPGKVSAQLSLGRDKP